ncbi:RNA polymerase Rpb8 [Colletotrichum karsti]|uniref:RNA polymerase Rpb8 n=1 Tax=Colletotrichum karsti TaxID=1095194 RepID=A0A9P6HUY5_9PEZI|nr:RNA polymerase Rpb8 [Colletotrichum karsti]KAF9869216.1 RNA polymerase Rpb8 [Colletotrichum karsti]
MPATQQLLRDTSHDSQSRITTEDSVFNKTGSPTRIVFEVSAIMSGGGDVTLFEESFTVTTYDQSKYDRVARISATSTDNQTIMSLDINIELFPASVSDSLHVVLATSLAHDGSKDDEKGWRDVAKGGQDREATLADMFDYVCYGKIYKFEDADDGQTIKAYVSFGGLLMSLEGPYKKLTPLRVDYVYLLIKK